MQKREFLGEVFAIQLTVDNMEQVEKLCRGRIRGTKLPPEERIVQFDDIHGGEQEISVGMWLVILDNGHDKVFQSWSNVWFKHFFK